MSPLDPLDEVVARDQIRQLPLSYAYAVDFRDADLLLSLWTEPEAEVEYPMMNLSTVRREHQRWFGKGTTVHFIGNHLITVDSEDRAHGDVYCWAQLDFGDEFIDQSILYQDSYVRQDERWLFESRRHLLFFGQARTENPFSQDDEGWPKNHTGRGRLPGLVRSESPRHEPRKAC